MIALSKDGPLHSVLLSFRHSSNNNNGLSSPSPSSSMIEVITILILFIIGILISGYSCFVIGTVLALESTRAAVRVFGGYRKEWIQFLRYDAIVPKNYCRSNVSATTNSLLLLKNKNTNKTSSSINKQTMTTTTTTTTRRNRHHFRPSTTNSNNSSSTIIYNNIKATTSRHPLTGNIIGYRVEYEYCCPDPDPDPVLVEDDDEESKNDVDDDNENCNVESKTKQQQQQQQQPQSRHRHRDLLAPMMRQHQKKRRPQQTTMIRIRRVIHSIRRGDDEKNEGSSNNNSNKNCNYDSSGSGSGSDSSSTRISYEYYPKETVRSLVEYIQREKSSEQKEKQKQNEQRRKPEKEEDHPDDSSSSSSSGSDDNYSNSDNDDDDKSSSSSDHNTADDAKKDNDSDTSLPSPSPSSSSSSPSSCTTGMMVLYPNNLNNQHKGIIMGYVNEKRRELITYSELIEPCIIHFGINFYLLGTFLHAFLTCPTMNNNNNNGRSTTDIYDNVDDDNDNEHICYEHVRNRIIIAIIGMIGMIPYCIYEARSIQIKRMKLWKIDPMLDISKYNELERIRNLFRLILFFDQISQDNNNNNNNNHKWYYYYMRKEIMYVPCFFWGIILLLLGCDIITLILGLTAVYCMVQWVHSSSPIKKDTLEGFKRDPGVVTNVIASLTIIDNNHNHSINDDDDDDDDIINSEYEKKKKKNRSSLWLWRSGRRFFGTDNNRNFVRIRYVVPSPSPSSSPFSSSGIDKNVAKTNTNATTVVVVKVIQSEFLHKKYTRNSHISTGRTSSAIASNTASIATTTTATTVPIHLDPDYPLSGYPTILLNRDISNSWSLLKWHVACLITLWCYLVSACVSLEVDVDGPPEDLWIAIIIMISGPFLLLPGASILRQIEFNRFLLELFEPTTPKSRIIIS
jgi:hypothetical protein